MPSLKGEANRLIAQMVLVMCDVDDFTPEDTVAANRSRMAKFHSERALAHHKASEHVQAIVEAGKAIDYMEGNL